MSDFVWVSCLILVYLTSDIYTIQKELVGFDDVFTHLRSGYRVSYFMKSVDCKSMPPPSQFHQPFGDTIDFFFAYEDSRGFTVAQFTSQKFIRQSYVNNTSNYDNEIILRQGVIDRNDMATWNISVTSLDMKVIIESWTFSCYFGNTSGTDESNTIRFYITDVKPQPVETVEDIMSALATGAPIRYTTWFIECQGDVSWLSIGGVIKDFDMIKVSNVTVIQSTQTALIRRDSTGFVYIVVTSNVTKLFGPYTNFIITDHDFFTHEQVYRGDEKCMLQSSGGVRYFISV